MGLFGICDQNGIDSTGMFSLLLIRAHTDLSCGVWRLGGNKGLGVDMARTDDPKEYSRPCSAYTGGERRKGRHLE